MKKKIYMLLALAATTLTAGAYDLEPGTTEHGTITFTVNGQPVDNANEGDVVTVKVTPDEGWVVNKPSGQWSAVFAAARAQRSTSAIDLLNAIELTPVAGQENQWTFTMKHANAEISATYKKVIQASWIQDITALTYTGQAQEPAITVKDGESTLVKDVDYTVAYSNNTSAALSTATDNAPTVTIAAVSTSQQYAGTATKTFTINKADITPTPPTALTTLVYTGEAQTLIDAGSAEGGEMQYSLDDKDYSTTLLTGTDAKAHTVYYKVVGDANHNDVAAQSLEVSIAPATLTSATLAETNFTYNQQEQGVVVTSVSAGPLTVADDSYDVTGNKGTNVASYTAIITGKGNFQGSVTAPWTIVAADASEQFSLALTVDDLPYDGTPKTPAIIVSDGDKVLEEGKDYIVDYDNNVDIGTGKIIVTATGNYTGTLETTFNIVKRDYDVTPPEAIGQLAFNGKPQALVKPGTVDDGTLLYSLDGKDYTTDVPTAINTGRYTVYYKVEGSDTYNDYPARSLQVSIAQGQGRLDMLNSEVTTEYGTRPFAVMPIVVLGEGALRFTSSNEAVATVNYYTGEITALGLGQTTVTVSMNSSANTTAATTSYVLTVKPAGAASVSVVRMSVGNGIPTFQVSTYRETLVEGSDYTLSYRDTEGHAVTEAEMLAAPGRYVVVVSLQGNYEGTREMEFAVFADPTAIGSPTVGGTGGTVRHDMSGRRVQKTHRGLIIENGKKRYVK